MLFLNKKFAFFNICGGESINSHKIPILHKSDKGVNASRYNVFSYHTHMHSYYEMTLYEPFDGTVTINDNIFKINTVTAVLIAPSDFHRIEVSGTAQSPFIKIAFDADPSLVGEAIESSIPMLSDKIFFVHFRNAVGDKYKFNETFRDNGLINMADIMKLYVDCGIDVPIRVDHVPLMAGETQSNAGYTALGRLFAIGYLKGILDSVCQ